MEIIVAYRAVNFQILFSFIQKLVNLLVIVLFAFCVDPCGISTSFPITMAAFPINVTFSIFL